MTAEFAVVSPARMDSSRLPQKPLADLGGKPMIVRVLIRAAESGAKRIAAAVDDSRVAAAVREFGFEAVMTGKHDSGMSRVGEAAEKMKIGADDIIVNWQGDEPFMPTTIPQKIADALADSDADCATAARPILDGDEFRSPHIVKTICDCSGNALYFSRSPIPYNRKNPNAAPAESLAHLGIYAYRRAALDRMNSLPKSPLEEIEKLEQLRLLWNGLKIAVVIVNDGGGISVDTPADLMRARKILEKK